MKEEKSKLGKGSGFDGDSWSDYFGDSTVYRCGKSGISVHLPDDSVADKADRGEDSAAGEDSGGLESDNAGDDDREEKENEMKQIIAWTLEISKGYRSIKFRFETGVEAQQFLIAWLNHKTEVDSYDKDEDEYSIYPVFEQDEKEE